MPLVTVGGLGELTRLGRKLAKIPTEVIPAAEAAALNRSSRQIKTRVKRGLSKQTRVMSKSAAKRVKDWRATKTKPRVKISLATGDMSAMRIAKRPRQTKTGVTVGGHKFPHAFLITPKKGGLVVAERRGKSRHPLKWTKLKIDPPAEPILNKVVGRAWNEFMAKNFAHEIDWRTKKFLRGL